MHNAHIQPHKETSDYIFDNNKDDLSRLGSFCKLVDNTNQVNLKQIRKSRWFKLGTNIYVLVSVFFIIWMLFFDTNSFRILWSLESKIDDLEHQKAELIRQIQEDKSLLKSYPIPLN